MSGGNGMYLEVSQESNVKEQTSYNLVNCEFINNRADTGRDKNITGFSRFDKGGGLYIPIRGGKELDVVVAKALISGNTAATYGGGLFASFSNNVNDSNVTVKNSTFIRNQAKYGGALYSGYLHNSAKVQTPNNSMLFFMFNKYTENTALYGGGVSVFSTKNNHDFNRVKFVNCTWKFNKAQFGSAIAVLPHAWNLLSRGYLPKFFFRNCTVDSNIAIQNSLHNNESQGQYSQAYGALYSTDHLLRFNDTNNFNNNNGSALYIVSCMPTFSKTSYTTFSNNVGYYGGAIHTISSEIRLEDNITIIFFNNTAYSKGGAIYHTSERPHNYNYSRTCFFKNIYSAYNHTLVSERRIIVNFSNNTAQNGQGHSMYIYSLLPCFRNNRYSKSYAESFEQIGTFSYAQKRPKEIATDTNSSHIDETKMQGKCLHIVPGKEEILPYEDLDELGNSSTSVYLVTVQNSNLKLTEAYQYISSNKIKLYGKTNAKATIVLSSLAPHQRTVFFQIKLSPCPPGYVMTLDPEKQQCECAYQTKSEYTGIGSCNTTEWRASRSQNYWVGYPSDMDENEESLSTGFCPIGYCSLNGRLLSSTANKTELNDIACAETHMGTLCGTCKSNHSVYYHNLHFLCKPNNYCKFGWLFFILSEVLPVTIIFVVVIFFNITFTSGNINGFLFFAQVVPTLRVTAGGIIPLTSKIDKIVLFIYHHFNLNPLVLEDMSFCLYKNASALDIMAISYITLVYAFLLTIGIAYLMNKFKFYKCCKFQKKNETVQGSIIHGLSSFLILCYAKCTQTSIMLITYVTIRGKGAQPKYRAAFYNGAIHWFGKEHLTYAIPAIVMLILIAIIPPILLLVYPIHYKVLSLLKISEIRCIKIIFRPLEKLKPMLDSFQGRFKDEFRFFSGLYFLNRLIILLNTSLNSFHEIYFILSIHLLVLLVLHAICQPYKKRIHNIVDTLLLVDLAAINAITTYNFAKANSNAISTKMFGLAQSSLMILPLLLGAIIILVKSSFCIKFLYKLKPIRQDILHKNDNMSTDMLQEMANYRKME